MAINLIGPDGKPAVLDNDANLDQAIELGYRQVTPEAPQSLGEKIKAGASDLKDTLSATAEGALAGFAPGLIGAALAKPTEETSTEKKVREYDIAEIERHKKESPIASTAGNLAGAIVSPLNKIAAPIEGMIGATSLAGRLAAKAASNAPVGTLFGAGNALDDATLGDHDLTAEKLIAGAGLGTVLGGAGGLFGGALEEGASAVAPLLKRGAAGAEDALKKFSGERWLKTVGIKSDIAKIPEAERPAVENEIRQAMTGKGAILPNSLEEAAANVTKERDAVAQQLLKSVGVGEAGGLKPGMNQEEALEAVGKSLDENGKKIGDILKKAEEKGATPTFSQALKRFDDFENGLNPKEKDLIQKDLDQVRGYLTKMGSEPIGPKNSFSALNSIKSTIQKDTNWVADGGAKFDLKRQLAGILRDEIDIQLAPQLGSDLTKEFLEAKNAFGVLSKAEKALTKKTATGETAIQSMLEDALLAQPSLAGRLKALNDAHNLIQHGKDRQIGNRVVSISDYLTGVAVSGHPLGALMGIPAAIGHKILRENASGVLAKLADRITKTPQLGLLASSFAKRLQTVAPQLGSYAQPLLNAASQSAAHALATHMVMAQSDPSYAEAAKEAGFAPETPEQQAHSLGKAHHLATIAGNIQAHDEELSRGIDKVFSKTEKKPVSPSTSSQDFGAKRMRRADSAEAHDERVKQVQELASNPQILLDRITANVGNTAELAPGITASVAKTANAAVQYLAKSVETPLPAGPLAPKWVPSEAEQHKFLSILEAVQDPMSTLKHAASRTLTEDQVQAVASVYPTWYRTAADQMLEKSTLQPKMPYAARLMVATFTGVDLDGSIGMTAVNQETIQRSYSKPAAEGGKPTGKLGGGKAPQSLAQRTALPGQAKEDNPAV